MAKLLLDPNTPVPFTVKYADVVSSQYGPEVRFKGSTPDDPDAICYEKLAPALDALFAAGALANMPSIPDALPPKGLAITLKIKHLVFNRVQKRGESYATFRVAVADGAPGANIPHAAPASAEPSPYREPAPTPREQAGPTTAAPRTSTTYLQCLKFVLEQAKPLCLQYDVHLSGGDVSAMTATVFINRMKEG